MARPTLETVAQAAGVSRQTVSNVLNTPERVSASTRERVDRVIAELGYRPSLAARQLRTQRSMTLALRLEPTGDGISGVVLDRFLHALVEAAQDSGYRVLLYTAADDGAEIDSYQDLLATSGVDGIVLTSTHHGDPRTAWLTEHDVPFSTFGRPWGARNGHHPWVDVDGAAGTRAAVAHLVSRGHRRIAFVGWPAGSGVGDDRRSGWRAGLSDAGLEPTTAYDVTVEDGVAQGADVTHRLMSLPEPPTAVVCASDSLAIGALATDDRLRPSGSRLAVVGFDDTPVAAAVGLTSVAQPLVDAARTCLQQVLAGIGGSGPLDRHVLLAPSLVERASTATAPP